MHQNVVSKICDFYQFPSKLITYIVDAINSKEEDSPASEVTLRLIKKWFKQNKVHLKLQFINSRATYTAYLTDVITDYSFILSCAKLSLIEIGYFSKIEEYKKIQALEFNNSKKTSSIRSFFHKFKARNNTHDDNIYPDRFNYHFIKIDINDFGQLDINLLIVPTNLTFKVPFNDLILDSSLLNNIYPPDLLKIGYEICCIDIHEKNQPTFYF